ncbi:MAG: hypothetical protein JO288_09630, partial [Hyphomicrobiales bacterium]|nr:hypothetical protein [Hyphomicrobiales bacterium]
SGVPRAYRLPYSARLAEKAEQAVRASANGAPEGGRTADYGTGAGDLLAAMWREITPTALLSAQGGDPSGGSVSGLVAQRESADSVEFVPLPSPRLPPKDEP